MNVVLFDTETTDLIANSALPIDLQPRVTEFYGMKIHLPPDAFGHGWEWEFVEEFDTLVNPQMTIPKESVKITGIDNSTVKDAPLMKDVWANVQALFADASWVVAHNLSYDMSVMDFEAERNGVEKIKWPRTKLCTVEATEHLKGHRMKLIDLHEHLLGVRFKEAHRAKNDVHALTSVFKELYALGEV